MFLYTLSPIDTWSGWSTEDEYKASEATQNDYDRPYALEQFEKAKAQALELGKRAGWEGDFSVGPMVAGLPNRGGDTMSGILIGWKQQNDGTTFVASPYRLPWLDEDGEPLHG